MRAGGWQTTLGIGLQGKVLGVVGLGKLGTQVARVVESVFIVMLAIGILGPATKGLALEEISE